MVETRNKNVHLQVTCESDIKILLDATSNMLMNLMFKTSSLNLTNFINITLNKIM